MTIDPIGSEFEPSPSQRASLGVRVMQRGKDYLSDKPGITTLEQLAEVRKTIAGTNRIYGIMYSERLEVKAAVKAGELVQAGAIGQVIQTINIAPHQIIQGHGDGGGGTGRPEWFWNPDSVWRDSLRHWIASGGSVSVLHRIYRGRSCRFADCQRDHPDHPHFQDFGDMMLRGNRGLGYVRLDWFTPDGLGTWGDGRLFILGTEGYIEVRKYTDVAVKKSGKQPLYCRSKAGTLYRLQQPRPALRPAVYR